MIFLVLLLAQMTSGAVPMRNITTGSVPTPRLTQSPVTWTINGQQFSATVEKPEAKDCSYWGATRKGNECVGQLIFNSSPQGLKCSVGSKYTNIVTCKWRVPK